jgi:hypothetical protein
MDQVCPCSWTKCAHVDMDQVCPCYSTTRDTMGVLPARRSTVIKPAFSRLSSARRFARRSAPRPVSLPFGKGKVALFAFHDRCNSQMQTIACGVRVARVACSIHHNGTFTNVSFGGFAISSSLLFTCLLLSRNELGHMRPDPNTARV